MKKLLKRLLKTINWKNLRNLEPISRVFGFDRGTPVDRVYIEHFLESNKFYIKGIVCEIAENTYSRKYGNSIKKSEIMNYSKDSNATIVGDLTKSENLPHNKIDCFILTQTLNFIFDFQSAIEGVYYMLKPGGVALVTVAGLSQISRYDMDKWGDFWRFTDLSIRKSFEKVFRKENIETKIYGNVLTATALLQGITAEELTNEELFYNDNNYQIVITIKAVKE